MIVSSINSEIYQQYLQGLLQGNRQQCQQAVDKWVELSPELRTLYEQLFQQSLYEIGSMWEHGQISVAVEHLATAITERLQADIYQRLFSEEHCAKSAIVSCAANEYHQIGARMVSDIFEMHGWRSWFLGANTPLPDLLNLINDKQPDIVTLSLTLHFNIDALLNITEMIRKTFPEQSIVIGGQAFQQRGDARFERIAGVTYMSSLLQLEKCLKSNC